VPSIGDLAAGSVVDGPSASGPVTIVSVRMTARSLPWLFSFFDATLLIRAVNSLSLSRLAPHLVAISLALPVAVVFLERSAQHSTCGCLTEKLGAVPLADGLQSRLPEVFRSHRNPELHGSIEAEEEWLGKGRYP
jgi:hypothetical protein